MTQTENNWTDLGNGAFIRAEPIEPGYQNNNRTKMWFITSIRVVPKDQRKPWFPKWFQRNILPIKRTIWSINGTRRKNTWAGMYKEFLQQWKDHHQESFPIDTRTWGFYSDKETALKAARENWSDLREGQYYKYVVVEGLQEGIYCDAKEEDQIFFEWVVDKVNSSWDEIGHWQQMDQPPKELIDIYSEHHIVFQFTSL